MYTIYTYKCMVLANPNYLSRPDQVEQGTVKKVREQRNGSSS